MDVEGLEHGGIYLQFEGERHHLDFRELTGGRWVTIYAQTEIVKDLIQARLAAGAMIEFEVSDTEVGELDTDRPVLRFTDSAGTRHEVTCDAIAGCDGFHGICRDSMPPGLVQVAERGYPYSWLGILASVPPSTDELIYCRHEDGFALHTMRTPQVSRLYLQVPADEDIEGWSDDRIWAELKHRLEVPGWELKEGHISEKAISPMRSFVASPMRYRRLFLAGDAAHIVPPTGAKGLNLALADVTALAKALTSLLKDGQAGPADAYSDTCLSRVWRATHFSWWMTSMLHVDPQSDQFGAATAALPAAVRHLLPGGRHHAGRELHRVFPAHLGGLSHYPRQLTRSRIEAAAIRGPGGAAGAGPGRAARTAPRRPRYRSAIAAR